MPFVSDKQRRYMNWAAARGEIKQSVVDEFNKASKDKKLPLRANEGGKIKTNYDKLKNMMGIK